MPHKTMSYEIRNINIAYWAGYKPALPVTANHTDYFLRY